MKNSEIDPTENKSKLPLYISLALLACLVLSYFFIPSVKLFFNEAWNVLTSNDNARIERWVSDFGWMGPVVLVLAMVAQMFLLVIPSIALMVVAILAYGPFWGSLIIIIAVSTASSVGYAIGTYLSERFVKKIIGPSTKGKIENFLEAYGFWAVVVTRLNPFLSNDAISFVAGILKMGYWKFMGATLLGIAPLTLYLAIIGENTARLKQGLLWSSLVSLIGFGAYLWWDRKRNK